MIGLLHILTKQAHRKKHGHSDDDDDSGTYGTGHRFHSSENFLKSLIFIFKHYRDVRVIKFVIVLKHSVF